MPKAVKTAVFVSGGGTNLQALIDSQSRGELKSASLELVLSSKPGAYALTRAQNAGIPHIVCDKKACDSQGAFEEEILGALYGYGIEFIILAGFMCILSADFTHRFENRIINVHPSLIPSFCGRGLYGLRVHKAALDYGVKVTGATVHFVNEVPDGGKIIMQKAVDVVPGDTPETLQKRVMEQAEWEILPRAAEFVCAGILAERAKSGVNI